MLRAPTSTAGPRGARGPLQLPLPRPGRTSRHLGQVLPLSPAQHTPTRGGPTPCTHSRGYRHQRLPLGVGTSEPERGCAGASVKLCSRRFPPSPTPPVVSGAGVPPLGWSAGRGADPGRTSGPHLHSRGPSSASPRCHNFPKPATPRAHSPAPRPPVPAARPPPPALPAQPPGSAAVCSILPSAPRSQPCERALGGGGGEGGRGGGEGRGGMKAARAPPRSNPPSAPHGVGGGTAAAHPGAASRSCIPVLHPATASRSGARGSGTSSRGAPLAHGCPGLGRWERRGSPGSLQGVWGVGEVCG